MKNLIGMVDYCQQVSSEFMYPKKPFDKNEWFGKILNYSDFLKQPLELWMFIPCDEDGNVLEEPNEESQKYDINISDIETDFDNNLFEIDVKNYQQAKERCLFEGFHVIGQDENYFELEMIDKDFWITFVNEKCQIQDEDFDLENIEHLLLNSIEDLQLTPTAIKQLQS